MYTNFFGFKEKPFKLVPNPEYLFLSKSHEEALAHLNYAISEGDGFVEITGEVGTGKTTLCRALLESLDQETVAAYIFNPKLGPKQLLKTISDELGILYDQDNTKDLIDKLNAFLLRQKAEGKRVLILIDEAQNLTKNVLEQLRLLSNLETNKEKLLQIILVGQPELAKMLESHELRQLGQRITLRYRLSELSRSETQDYIQYRLNVAAQRKGIHFERAAGNHIYKYSKGVPRLVNIACDRALLTAFGLNQHRITGAIAKAAIAELNGRGRHRSVALMDARKALVIFTALSLAAFAVLFHKPIISRVSGLGLSQAPPGQPSLESAHASVAGQQPELQVIAEVSPPIGTKPSPAPPVEVSPSPPPPLRVMPLADWLREIQPRESRYRALKQALSMWDVSLEGKPYLENLEDDRAYFRLLSKPSGVFIHRVRSDLDLLRKLNVPAILEFYPPGMNRPGYLTLLKIDGDEITLGMGEEGREIRTDPEEINFYWSGVAYVPWKNYLSIYGTIPKQTFADSIVALKLLLREIGFQRIPINTEYDATTRDVVEELQQKYGIPVDGFVGPLTKIILYREKQSYTMPQIAQ
jgi:general secretion pathway protein A